MKTFPVVIICLAAILDWGSALRNRTQWENYKKMNKKSYHGRNETFRQQLFFTRNQIIESFNNRTNTTHKLRHNKFSDQTEQELNALLGFRTPQFSVQGTKTDRSAPPLKMCLAPSAFPESYDLRTDPCLAPVKNQGSCGSCWAFAAITPLEFSNCKKYNQSTILSEQQLIDCDTGGTDYGCFGGLYTTAWDYLIQANGSATSSSYPYTGYSNSECSFQTSMIGAQVFDYTLLPIKNVNAIKWAILTHGPVSAAMCVVGDFFLYSSGVYSSPYCNRTLNHAVVIVGWGSTPDTNISYWIVRNSWGRSWGIDGYFYLQRGVDQCKIESNPYHTSFVIPV